MTTTPDHFSDNGEESERSGGGSDRAPLSGCELFDSVAAELALGSLTGSERSAALAHLDGCEHCQELIKDLSTTADALLLVAPEADPAAGFEVRLLARFHQESTANLPTHVSASRRGSVIPLRRRASVMLAAAAAAFVIAGAGIGIGVAVRPQQGHQSATTAQIRVATLQSVATPGKPATAVGEVAVTSSNPSWVLMTFHKPGWSGWVYCLVTQHGQSKEVGSFWLHDGSGSWAVRLPSSGASVTSAAVLGPKGSVFATAALSS
jgi:hypothetical protein